MMASVRVDKGFYRRLARQAKPAVRAAADEIGARAMANLAAHKETGEARIVVDYGYIDSYVILDDPASLSIEFGRSGFTRKSDGRFIGPAEGLHVLSRAVRGG